jgi:hypothetical protein
VGKSARAVNDISPSSFQRITAHAGQRLLSLESDKFVIYDSHAVPASMLLPTHWHATTNITRTKTPRRYRRRLSFQGIPGTCFQDAVASRRRTRSSRSARSREGYMVLIDGERLEGVVRAC